VAFRGSELAVLTASEIHLFTPATHRVWSGGRDLADPRELTWAGDRILVRDAASRRLVAYNREGTPLSRRALRGLAISLAVNRADTLVELHAPDLQTLIRMHGTRSDTIVQFALSNSMVTLSEPGAPTLTLTVPFTPRPMWAVLSQGQIAYWDGRERWIRLLNRAGRIVERLALPQPNIAVTAADRNHWIDKDFPATVRGEPVFERLRAQARSRIPFPSTFPPAMAFLADGSGGVWVMQSPSSQGQRWVHLEAGRRPLSIRLPRGQWLLAAGDKELAVHARTPAGDETIILYANPRAQAVRR
jgi:hypothetical protein